MIFSSEKVWLSPPGMISCADRTGEGSIRMAQSSYCEPSGRERLVFRQHNAYLILGKSIIGHRCGERLDDHSLVQSILIQ